MGFLSMLTGSKVTHSQPGSHEISKLGNQEGPAKYPTTRKNRQRSRNVDTKRAYGALDAETVGQSPVTTSSLGGVFVSTGITPPSSTASGLSCSTCDETVESAESASTSTLPVDTPWKRTDTKSFVQQMPLFVRNPEDGFDLPEVDDKEELRKILVRARSLPDTWYFSSNHVMVNQERVKCSVSPVSRLQELDEIARFHATAMAREKSLFRMTPAQLQHCFPRVARRLGVNVAVGESIRDIHESMMTSRSDRNNILDRRYTNMGMGTARSSDGELFLCQIFRG
jgi:Cysteine-rich secretory protein family